MFVTKKNDKVWVWLQLYDSILLLLYIHEYTLNAIYGLQICIIVLILLVQRPWVVKGTFKLNV